MSDDLAARVDDLEEQLERQHQAHEAYNEQVVKPKLEELAEARDDARSERAEHGCSGSVIGREKTAKEEKVAALVTWAQRRPRTTKPTASC